jgi:hypothetical protein
LEVSAKAPWRISDAYFVSVRSFVSFDTLLLIRIYWEGLSMYLTTFCDLYALNSFQTSTAQLKGDMGVEN